MLLPLVLPLVLLALVLPSSRQLADSKVEPLLETQLFTFPSTLLPAKYRNIESNKKYLILTTIQVWQQGVKIVCLGRTIISALLLLQLLRNSYLLQNYQRLKLLLR